MSLWYNWINFSVPGGEELQEHRRFSHNKPLQTLTCIFQINVVQSLHSIFLLWLANNSFKKKSYALVHLDVENTTVLTSPNPSENVSGTTD